MKLRKALEKAKMARQDEGAGEIGKTEASSTDTKQEGEKAAAPGWKAPTYTESRHVVTDERHMENNRLVGMFPQMPELDHYKVLRTQIEQRTKEKSWNTIMITSTEPNEGKTVTTINLALTFAKAYNQTVLLVDCDLKKQRVHQYFGIPSEKGIVDYLLGDQPLKDIIIWPGIDKMTLISGGRRIQDSTEILGSPRMRDLVSEMKNRYEDRYVLFDVPPVLAGADALAFAPLVDCIVMVVEEGKTSMQNIKKAMELIPTEKFLGFVMNKQRIPDKNKYGYYAVQPR